MNKFAFFILFVSCSAYSQVGGRTIKISSDIELIQLSENAYIHVSYAELPGFGRFSSNGLLFSNQGKAFLFDTPVNDSLTCELVNYIKDSMKLELIGFVPNHWHADCMGGLDYLNKSGIPSYANQITIETAKQKRLPLPKHDFKDSITLKLDRKEIKCYFLGAAHSLDNVVVWIPSEKILFPGCMAKEIKANSLGNTVDGDLNEYPKTIKKLIEKFPGAKIIVPGHGAYGDRELLIHTLELTNKK
jgi:metallo-beta-lactamase class B